MYNNYNNSPNLISIGSVVSSQQKTFFNKLLSYLIFFKTCSCSLVTSQTNVDDVSMYTNKQFAEIRLVHKY